jgi:valyl-tRNA synthetase
VREGRTRIIPAHFEKVYAHWMENIHDWAVGRQLWWGHRIPAWYCPDGHITVSDAEAGPDGCAECGVPADRLVQETDIFDTWFSSGLWPFSTLGWPDQTADLARFYPTSVMETAYEILFFWVARMMMLGLFCTDVEPFHTVYLHGIVRDPYGQKMSKTKGNVVDPLEMIEEVGADALRFALVSGNAPGVDQRLTSARITGGRNFTTKLWNAARFVLGAKPEGMAESSGEPTLAERWIRSRLADAMGQATRQLDQLDLAGYLATAHEFVWSDYCDWFLEMAKIDLRRPGADPGVQARVWGTAAETLAGLLRLLHPIMPFVTEEIWHSLSAAAPAVAEGQPLLIRAPWPETETRDPAAEDAVSGTIQLITELRDQRNAQGVPSGARVVAKALPASETAAGALERSAPYIEALGRIRPFELLPLDAAVRVPPSASSTRLAPAVWIEAEGLGQPESDRRDASREELAARIGRVRELLGKPEFVERAPAAVVARERERLAELEEQLQALAGG